jgi:hypothetical protein
MKDTLEYKILKHLKDNDNGDFVVMKGFIEDENKLTNKLLSLSKKPEHYISFSSPVTIFGGNSPAETFGEISAKIEFNGIKYLDNLEKEIIELKLAESNIKANELNKTIAEQNEKNEKFNKFSTIANILIGLLNVCLLIWQILKD